MKTIYILAVLVLMVGCSTSSSPKSISAAKAAEIAWAEMESTPADPKAIAGLIAQNKLRVEQIESDDRQAWRVIRTDAPPTGVFMPVRKPLPTDAIAAPPQTPWIVAVDMVSGEIVWKHRNTVR